MRQVKKAYFMKMCVSIRAEGNQPHVYSSGNAVILRNGERVYQLASCYDVVAAGRAVAKYRNWMN